MMIVMKPTATKAEIQAVIDRIESVGAKAHPSIGEELTVIGAIGDREHVARLGLEGAPGALVAGPCTVEARDQVLSTADTVKEAGATMRRGGAYKPRTSPYAFSG